MKTVRCTNRRGFGLSARITSPRPFEYAHEADPAAELRYNDYSLENERKRNGAIALVKQLQAQKVPISGLGSQTHANLTQPSAESLDQTLAAFAELRLPIS